MRYFNGCVYAASLRKENEDIITSTDQELCKLQSFSKQDLKNIEKMAKDRNSQKLHKREQIESRNKKRTIEYETKRNDLQLFNLSQELIPYGKKAQKSMIREEFWPTFAKFIKDFDTKTKCFDQIPDKNYLTKLENNLSFNLDQTLNYILYNIFGFETFRIGQKEAVISFIQKNNTLVLMPTGANKTFCYIAAALISK
ncbi:15108_t:CDS:2, partial [Racocetra fulgida]